MGGEGDDHVLNVVRPWFGRVDDEIFGAILDGIGEVVMKKVLLWGDGETKQSADGVVVVLCTLPC